MDGGKDVDDAGREGDGDGAADFQGQRRIESNKVEAWGGVGGGGFRRLR